MPSCSELLRRKWRFQKSEITMLRCTLSSPEMEVSEITMLRCTVSSPEIGVSEITMLRCTLSGGWGLGGGFQRVAFNGFGRVLQSGIHVRTLHLCSISGCLIC